MSIESKAEQLLNLASSENTPEINLGEILDQHWACFDGELCSVCEFIDEDMGSLIEAMAENPSITPEIQDRLYEAALMWQGKGYGFLLSLAGNPNISGEYKALCLDCDIWSGMNEGLSEMQDVLDEVLEALESNDAFSKNDLKTFKKQFKASYI